MRPAGPPFVTLDDYRPEDALGVDSGVLVEPAVLDGDDGVLDVRRHLVQWNPHTVLGIERRDRLAVGGEYPGGLRRRLDRQFFGQAVEEADRIADPDPGCRNCRDNQAGQPARHTWHWLRGTPRTVPGRRRNRFRASSSSPSVSPQAWRCVQPTPLGWADPELRRSGLRSQKTLDRPILNDISLSIAEEIGVNMRIERRMPS